MVKLNFEEIRSMSDDELKVYCDNINSKIETIQSTNMMMNLAQSQSQQQKDAEAWFEFRSSGFLWMINSILHIFGYAIFFILNDKGELTRVVPKRAKFRGFTEERNSIGYKRVSQYMAVNAEQLLKEASDMSEDELIVKKVNYDEPIEYKTIY